MSTTHQPGETPAWERWREREALLDGFEAAWRRGERPAIDDYRPLRAAADEDLLAKLVQTDLEFRLKAGEPARVEAYLERYPGLAGDDEAVLDLVAAEYELRRRPEPGLDVADYTQRFAGRDEALRARLQRAGKNRVTVPGYEVLGELGRGGLGVVYKARQTILNRTVALKMILAAVHAGPSETARFRREAEATARLQHPNIVQVYEVGEEAGRPYLVMEYVEGGSLAERFAGKPVDARRAAGLIETLARTIHTVHQHGIIHRDLKPANVLLTANETPKITDFGLAKQMEQEARHTHSGAILGTPAYMAPEQAAGQTAAVGSWSDVYALGAILYELLTGRPPFQGATPLATLQQVVAEEPAAPSRLQAGLPADLETICLKCLHKEPGRRYGSAQELAEELRRFLNGEPIRARSVGLWERARKWARRRPAAAALVAVSLLAVLGLAGGMAWFTLSLNRALDQRTQELRAEQQAREGEARARQYVGDLRLAYQFWKTGDTTEGKTLLPRQRPAKGADDRRGFEWYYLWRQCDRLRGTFPAHIGGVFALALTQDGRILATGGADAAVRLWDTATWEARATLTGHAGPVHGLAFSPEGGLLASAGDDGTVRLWDVPGCREQAVLRGHRGPVRCVAVSAHGNWLASGGEDGFVKLWDLPTRTERAKLSGNRAPVSALAFSPDGQTLVGEGLGIGGHLWGVPAGDVRQSWNWGNVQSLALSPDGRMLALGGAAGAVLFRDLGLRRFLDPLAGEQTGLYPVVAFTPDGRALLSGGDDGRIWMWGVHQSPRRAVIGGHDNAVRALLPTPDGRLLISAGADGTVRLWDLTVLPGVEPLGQAFRPDGPLAFAPDGKTLAVADRDHTVKRLDPDSGRILATFRGHRGPVRGVAFSPDGRSLATAGEDATVRLWDADDGRERRLFSGHRQAVTCIAFSPDGRRLASGSRDGDVKLWDVAGTEARATLSGHPGAVSGLVFSADGQTLVSADLAGAVRLWEAATGRLRASPPVGDAVLAAAFAPGGHTFATGHPEGVINLWDAASGQKSATLAVNRGAPGADRSGVCSLAFSPDGRTLVAGKEVRRLTFWDVRTRRRVREVQALSGPMHSLAFAPDGTTLAGTSADGLLAVLNLSRWSLHRPPGQPPLPVHALAFSADGGTLLTGSSKRLTDGTHPDRVSPVRHFVSPGLVYDQALAENDADIRCWDLAHGQELAALPGQESFGGVRWLARSSDGRTLAAGSRTGVLWLWDLEARRRRPAFFLLPESRREWQRWEAARRLGLPLYPEFKWTAWSFALAPDGRTLAGALPGAVRLWELSSGQELGVLPSSLDTEACLVFSPDGTLFAVGAGNKIELWDVARRQQRWTLSGHQGTVDCLAFAPDGTLLASAGRDRGIRLWDLHEGRERARLLGHTDRVAALAFARDGRTLASGGWDHTVRLWDVASGAEFVALEGHRGPVHTVAFSPDGNTLATGGETPEGCGEVYLWRASPRSPPVE